MDLPPGFRFHPTNEEIITHYLAPKIVNPEGFTATAIAEVDLNRCEPWELPSKAKMRGEEMYFFCHRDRKYPTGSRTNRATESGYWKATGKDKEIYNGRAALVGMKKTLVFYKGRAPKGEKTNWVMHEFRIEGKHSLPKSAKDEWVVCRVFHKNIGVKRTMEPNPSFNVRNDQFFDFGGANIPPTRSQQVNIFNRQLNSSPAAPQNPLFGSQLLVGSNSTADLAGYFLHHQHEPMLTSVVNTAENCFGLQQQQQPHHSPETDRNTDISSVLSKQYDDFDETWTSYGF